MTAVPLVVEVAPAFAKAGTGFSSGRAGRVGLTIGALGLTDGGEAGRGLEAELPR